MQRSGGQRRAWARLGASMRRSALRADFPALLARPGRLRNSASRGQHRAAPAACARTSINPRRPIALRRWATLGGLRCSAPHRRTHARPCPPLRGTARCPRRSAPALQRGGWYPLGAICGSARSAAARVGAHRRCALRVLTRRRCLRAATVGRAASSAARPSTRAPQRSPRRRRGPTQYEPPAGTARRAAQRLERQPAHA
jgi:hypothetical protein